MSRSLESSLPSTFLMFQDPASVWNGMHLRIELLQQQGIVIPPHPRRGRSDAVRRHPRRRRCSLDRTPLRHRSVRGSRRAHCQSPKPSCWQNLLLTGDILSTSVCQSRGAYPYRDSIGYTGAVIQRRALNALTWIPGLACAVLAVSLLGAVRTKGPIVPIVLAMAASLALVVFLRLTPRISRKTLVVLFLVGTVLFLILGSAFLIAYGESGANWLARQIGWLMGALIVAYLVSGVIVVPVWLGVEVYHSLHRR